MQALRRAVAEQRARAACLVLTHWSVQGSEPHDHAGSLELSGFKNKLYVAVSRGQSSALQESGGVTGLPGC